MIQALILGVCCYIAFLLTVVYLYLYWGLPPHILPH